MCSKDIREYKDLIFFSQDVICIQGTRLCEKRPYLSVKKNHNRLCSGMMQRCSYTENICCFDILVVLNANYMFWDLAYLHKLEKTVSILLLKGLILNRGLQLCL